MTSGFCFSFLFFVPSDVFVCFTAHLFITRAPTASRAAEPGREKESLVLGQGLLGRWRWDGEIEKEKERNSRREGGGEESKARRGLLAPL